MADAIRPLADDLIGIVGAEHVVQDADAVEPLRQVPGPFPRIGPGIVAAPGSPEEIAAVLRLANERLVPVISRGGAFSMTGFVPREIGASIILDTRRLDRVLDIDVENMTVTAEAGIIVGELEAQVEARGFEIQTVGVPLFRSTLGGMLSGVMGGGLPRDTTMGGSGRQVIGMKVVLPNGRIVQTNAGGSNVGRSGSALHDGDGPGLTGMFIGDAGSLGIKVAATLQMTPAAGFSAAAKWMFDDFDSVWRALGQLASIRESPYTSIGVDGEGPPWGLSYASSASTPDLLSTQVRRTEDVLVACGGSPDPSDDTAVPSREWFISIPRAIVSFMLGRAQFIDAYRQIRALLDERIREQGLDKIGVEVRAYHYPYTRHGIFTSMSVVYDPAVPEGASKVVELAKEAYRLAVAVGAYVEPQQGIASQIIAEGWSPEYAALYRGMKAQLDPNGILNPGLWGVD